VVRRATRPGPASTRLLTLLGGDLPDHRRETSDDGRVRFVPAGGGPVLEVASRIEKRFLGRTEIAVFEADLEISFPEEARIELRHTGRLKRTGIVAVLIEGGDRARQLAEDLTSDSGLAEVLLALDFTRFEIHADAAGSRVLVELIGASHVAIALPPIRSYVHLFPDQREAMVAGVSAVRRVLQSM
jgi:hypothetical protein